MEGFLTFWWNSEVSEGGRRAAGPVGKRTWNTRQLSNATVVSGLAGSRKFLV